MGDDFLVQKLLHVFFMCLTIIMFCAGFFLFFRYAFPLNSDDFSVMAFFLQLHFMLISQHFYGLFYRLISVIFPWKVRIHLFYFLVTFHLIFNGILFILFHFKPCYWAILFIRLSIRLFIRCFFFLSFELFSCLYLFFIRVLCSC